MTTTRPYRKALDIREALTRLEDAAGTQLDEPGRAPSSSGSNGADPPLPGGDVQPLRLWTPYRHVA